jgi:Mg-chelatase subunit ChlI
MPELVLYEDQIEEVVYNACARISRGLQRLRESGCPPVKMPKVNFSIRVIQRDGPHSGLNAVARTQSHSATGERVETQEIPEVVELSSSERVSDGENKANKVANSKSTSTSEDVTTETSNGTSHQTNNSTTTQNESTQGTHEQTYGRGETDINLA